ncbi:BamA/TamA family outer membrane protein [Vibrio parahaemolyticus]
MVSDASTIAVPLIYTSNDSYVAKVAGDIILFEDNFRLSFETGFTSTNLNFNGSEGNKEQIDFDADFMFKVAEDMFVGVGGIYESSRYTAKHRLEQPSLEGMGFSSDYVSDVGYRLSFQWDTREQFYYPHSGYMWQSNFEDHAEWLGNDEDNTYQSLFSDYRYFYSLDEQSHHIIATKLVGRYLFDADKALSSAFTTYGRQGKEVQRGYAQGDYIASNMLNLEVEYRHQFSDSKYDFVNNSAVVAIGGIGKSFGEKLEGYEESFRDSDWLGGGGLRIPLHHTAIRAIKH